MESHKAHFRAKVLSQTTVLEGRTFCAFKCLLFFEGWPTPSGVAQIGLRAGSPLKRLVSLGGIRRALIFGFEDSRRALGSGLVGCRGV